MHNLRPKSRQRTDTMIIMHPACLPATAGTTSLPAAFLSADQHAYLSTYLHAWTPLYLPTYLPACLSVCLPACLPIFLSACLPVYLPAYHPACLPADLLICLPAFLCAVCANLPTYLLARVSVNLLFVYLSRSLLTLIYIKHVLPRCLFVVLLVCPPVRPTSAL